MIESHYIDNPTFRKFEAEKSTYYIPVDTFVNAADNVLVDTHDPNSRGFGGSTFKIKMTDGEDTVKGPWHGTAKPEHFIGELHFTKVTLIVRAKHVNRNDWPHFERGKSTVKGCDCVVCRFGVVGEIIYDEKEMVLGPFYRGDRIAQQLADLRNETLYVQVETNGGSHSYFCKPGGNLHPRAHRSGRNSDNDLSAEQGSVVYG